MQEIDEAQQIIENKWEKMIEIKNTNQAYFHLLAPKRFLFLPFEKMSFSLPDGFQDNQLLQSFQQGNLMTTSFPKDSDEVEDNSVRRVHDLRRKPSKFKKIDPLLQSYLL